MPRLSTRLLIRARSIHPLLPLLLRACRELRPALNELRWLHDHSLEVAKRQISKTPRWEAHLRRACVQRSRGRPLQYILGSEYFGEIKIQCKPGVLIPRPETAEAVTALVNRLRRAKGVLRSNLRVLDLCSGTGCISLLFYHLWTRDLPTTTSECQSSLQIVGVDISPAAIRLSRANLQQHFLNLVGQHDDFSFVRGDILANSSSSPSDRSSLPDLLAKRNGLHFDVLVSNPPYISPREYSSPSAKRVARSVRVFEPRLALVPPPPSFDASVPVPDACDGSEGDTFYAPILAYAHLVKAKVVLLEVGGYAQALRVVTVAVGQGIWTGLEIWRDDWLSVRGLGTAERGEFVWVKGKKIHVRGGDGEGRCVFCWREVDLDERE